MRRTAMPSHVGTHGFVLMVNKGATVAIRRFINAKYLLHVTLAPPCARRSVANTLHVPPDGQKIASSWGHVSTMKADRP